MRTHHPIPRLVILGLSCVAVAVSVFGYAAGDDVRQELVVPSSKGGASDKGTAAAEPSGENTVKEVTLPVYRPPLRGSPEGRVAGGSRSPEDDMPSLHFLAPDHVGLTTKAQPVLYWFVSAVNKYPLEICLVDVRTHEPLVEVHFKPPLKPGMQAFRLADYGVRLEVGVLYRVFVTMIPNPGQPSKNLVSFGDIRRIEVTEPLAMTLKGTPGTDLVHVYAREGLWYDALAAVSASIGPSPKEKLLRKQRAALLRQGGLNEVAEYEEARTIPSGSK